MNGWERLAWNHGARRHPRGSLDIIWDTGSLVQKNDCGFSPNVNQATLSSMRNVGVLIEFVVFCQEARRWGLELWLLSQSFYCGAHMLWGWGPIPVELRGPGTHKSSLNIIGQNVTVQTPNVSENLPYQPSEKDDHVLEVMSTFPDILSYSFRALS